jgi:WD40 repeat protein
LPKKSPLLIGIVTSFAAVSALTAGSYYFLRSPGPIPEVKTPVAIPSKKLVSSENALKMTLAGHLEGVWAVALSGDSKTLVSGSGDKTIKIWNLDSGQLIRYTFWTFRFCKIGCC